MEYQRKAYVASENKTRITFDFAIKATESDFRLFSPTLNQNPVLDPYLVVMEVKYNGCMLSYIKQMISRYLRYAPQCTMMELIEYLKTGRCN